MRSRNELGTRPTVDLPMVWVLRPAKSLRLQLEGAFADICRFQIVDSTAALLAEWRRCSVNERAALLVSDLEPWSRSGAVRGAAGFDVPWVIVSRERRAVLIEGALASGALDYFVYPLERTLFQAKLRFWLRHKLQETRLDAETLSVFRNGRRIQLTVKEYRILAVLRDSPDESLHKEGLFRKVWRGVAVGRKTVDVHLFNLRRKLEPIGIQIRYLPSGRYQLMPVPERPSEVQE